MAVSLSALRAGRVKNQLAGKQKIKQEGEKADLHAGPVCQMCVDMYVK
jgi:hypothetical protein